MKIQPIRDDLLTTCESRTRTETDTIDAMELRARNAGSWAVGTAPDASVDPPADSAFDDGAFAEHQPLLGGQESEPELPAWAARRGGSREAALARAGPLHSDDLLVRQRFKPARHPDDYDPDEISFANLAPKNAGKVLRRMRNSNNLRFRNMSAAGDARGEGHVEVWPIVAMLVVLLLAYFRPWPLS